ncbi:hypothetical protein [Spiroplasma endosymbiont of Othius punctulatus]|uniref:hypothetical protein n=1 Tax=Spiroplasma endosymbiont of Othius punctulatus TaxID=3066289 RepID=UPI0030D56D03
MIQAFIILGAIFFCVPFLVWMVVRFLDRQRSRPIYYKKRIIAYTFLGSFLLMVLFFTLSVVLSI